MDNKLRAELEKNSQENDEAPASLEAEISLVREALEQDKATIDDLGRQITDKELEAQNQRAMQKQVELDVSQVRDQISRVGREKEAVDRRLGNKWNVYGNRIRQVIDNLNGRTWSGYVPLGPLGEFVELLDQSWHVPVKAAIGPYMASWVVGNVADRRTLLEILLRNGKCVICVSSSGNYVSLIVFHSQNVRVLVSRMDNFDYSSGVPQEGIPTILRVLRVSRL